MPVHPSAVTAALLSTGFISLAPNVLLFLFPNYASTVAEEPSNVSSNGGRALLSLGQALAVGGLMGDVFLHTLPECFANAMAGNGETNQQHDHEDDSHQHHHHHGGGDIGLRVLAGFAAFFIMDIVVRSLEGTRGGGSGHSHSNSKSNRDTKARSGKRRSPSWRAFISSTVLLNLLGDALHNFTDGLAIGATFAASQPPPSEGPTSWLASSFHLLKSRGGLASVSVLLHEIPHELGDFATLVNAGLSRNMAIGAQFLTAVAAFAGTVMGLFSDQLVGLGHEVLLPFTAGGFIYLACVTILPDILESNVSALMRSLQIAFLGLGVAFMYFVAALEEMEGNHNHHHHGDVHQHDEHHHDVHQHDDHHHEITEHEHGEL